MNKFFELLEAIARTSLQRVKDVLEDQSINVKEVLETEDASKYTPLFHACLNERQQFGLEVVKMMLSKGANPLHLDKNGQDVMYYLAKDGKDKIMKLLLSQFKFDLNRSDYILQTALFWAASKSKISCASLLLSHGADPNHVDFNGQTPIFYAASAGHLEMCKKLVDSGANFQQVDKNRQTPLNYARKSKNRAVVDFFNGLKNQKNRQKQMSRMESSAQESKMALKKKEVPKNQYCLVYTNEKGQVHELTIEQIQKFGKASYENKNVLALLVDPDRLDSEPNPEEKKFEKIANKILSAFMKHQQGALFLDPVDYVAMGIPDYPIKISNPMDFTTIKTKLNLNCYASEDEFCSDMNLVFDNCITYNGPQNYYGKVATQLKFQFYAMYKKEFTI